MKFDKELLLKHKFWVLLAVSVPLSLAAIFLLVTAVSGDISRTKKIIEDKLKAFTSPGEIKSPREIAEKRREADIEKDLERIVHAKAFEKQEPLFLWPQRVESEFDFRSGLFAQQIKIGALNAAPPAEAPKDEERLIHGTVSENAEANYIEVLGYDKKKYKFYRSVAVTNNAREGADKPVEFQNIQKGDQVAVSFHRGKYYNETLTNAEQDTYTQLGVYLSQIDPLLAQVEPMNDKGEGVVQLHGWFYKKGELPPEKAKFLTFLAKGWENVAGDISEEAWLAQEDIWVQQELYRLIRLANDYVSKFDGQGGEDKNKVYTFKNPFWEIGVKWPGGNNLVLSLKNMQNRRQKLDLGFRIRFHKTLDQTETIQVGGEPLGPKGTKEAEREVTIPLKDNALRKGIYGVEQLLTWETAAVKRIDQITIGSLAADDSSHSHRTFPEGLQPLKKVEVKGEDPKGPGGMKDGFKPPQDGGFGNGAGGGNDLTKRGLIRNRYVEVTPQSRRIPVALALIVDQSHIDRVQTAFSNSRLRFLTTQVLLNRYPGSLRPQLEGPAAGNNFGPQKPAGPAAAPKFGPMGPAGPMGPMGVGPAAVGPAPSSSGGSDDMDTNFEMVLYGIVTLYERYPPPLQAAAPADAR